MCLSGRLHPAAVLAPRPATRPRAVQQSRQFLHVRALILTSPYEHPNKWFPASACCKKGTPHCCDAPLFGQGSQTNGKQLPLKLLVLSRHRQPGVPAKTTQARATLRFPTVRKLDVALPGRWFKGDSGAEVAPTANDWGLSR
jgi:hypothetical protein